MLTTNSRQGMVIGYQCVEGSALGTRIQEVLDQWPDGTWSAWLEDPLRSDGIELQDASVDRATAAQLWEYWPMGQLFQEHAQLRWEKLDEKYYQLVLIADGQQDSKDSVLAAYQGLRQLMPYGPQAEKHNEERLMLWGRTSDLKGWSVERIPKLRYPSTWQGPYAALYIRRYLIEADRERPYDSIVIRMLRFDGNVRL